MRLILFICLLPLLTRAAKGDSLLDKGTLTVGNTRFVYKKILSTEFDSTITFELYRGDKKIINHHLFREQADCNSLSLELGNFQVGDSSITFYSYWAWEGGCCGNPYGARKQIYRLEKNRALLLAESQICLQSYKTKVSQMGKQQAQAFMAKVENYYNAKFVTGWQADDLLAQIKQRFAKDIATKTKGWERNRYGYMR